MTLDDALAENAYLRSELGLARDVSTVGSLRRAFRLTVCEAVIVASLYSSRHKAMTSEQLFDMTRPYSKQDDTGYTVVNAIICKTRRKMGDGLIATVRGMGYQLTPAGIRICAEVLDGG